jgi:L-2-hydroxycarboxylate dehydrogenase (NAD+)
MKVKLSEIRRIMADQLSQKDYEPADIQFITNMYLGGEVSGHVSHGLASFPAFLEHDYASLPEPEIVKETAACFYLDAKGSLGDLIGRRAADEAIKRAKKEIIGFSLIKDMDSWLRPGAIAEYIAEQDLLAYVVNSGGGAAIAAPGGYQPVAGTNPIAYGLPTEEGAFVVDIATSKRAWGTVRQANKYGTLLPDDTFYDKNGNITTNPSQASAVLPFGGYKGFSLALLAETMCGALTGTQMMISSSAGNQYGQKMPMSNRGAYILVIDPAQTVGLDVFKQQVSDYMRKIEQTKPLPNEKIRIPGRESMKKVALAEKTDEIDIPETLWEEIKSA